MNSLVTLLAALIGALIGSLGPVLLQNFVEERRQERLERSELAREYLYNLQDASESLWFRLNNLENRQGRDVMTQGYFEVSTLFTIARALASERLLHMQGVYSRIDSIDEELSNYLRSNQIDTIFEGMGFYRYHRQALAETALTANGMDFRLSTYLEFRDRYMTEIRVLENQNNSENALHLSDTGDSWVVAARNAVNNIDSANLRKVMDKLKDISQRISTITGVDSSI